MEFATQIVDKLQEENRSLLNTLHKAQDTIKYQEKQLAEKDRRIKVLEERIRARTDGILARRQKELTIRHLEAQIKKLMNENEDSEVTALKSDYSYAISCLQERLQESLTIIAEYENENKALKEELEKVKSQGPNTDLTTSSKLEQKNKLLQTQLDVAEKNIKTCENVIVKLKNTVKCFEEENEKLESELVQVKSKAISAKNTTLCSKISETLISNLEKLNQDLQDKVNSLEEANKKLIETSQNVSTKNIEYQTNLLKLNATEKQINTLEKIIETLQGKLKTAENDKEKLNDNLKALEWERRDLELEIERLKEKSAVAYEDNVMALKNALILKEDENKRLVKSLLTLENKTLEMNRYRKSLHQEIKILCKDLIENDEGDDSECHKGIYKAAVLRSAQALLSLDGNYNFKSNDSSNILDELTHQIQVYLTEVSRINELITIKELETDNLLEELDQDHPLLKPSFSCQRESGTK